MALTTNGDKIQVDSWDAEIAAADLWRRLENMYGSGDPRAVRAGEMYDRFISSEHPYPTQEEFDALLREVFPGRVYNPRLMKWEAPK